MAKSTNTRIQNKHDIEANWIRASGFIPLAGELIIYDAETQATFDASYATLTAEQKEELGRTTPIASVRVKIGDGKTVVKNLGFINDASNLISTGTTDPSASTQSQFYFKYATN